MRGPATLRNCFALLLAGVGASACPALLEDDFTTVPAAFPDAGSPDGGAASGGASGADASSGGTLGSAGVSGSQGSGGSSGSAGSADSGGEASADGGICNCGPGELCCEAECVDRLTSRSNCGACGIGCPGTTCTSAQCTNVCALGFLDCDHNVVNGCEVNAAMDPQNCGSCGIECPFEATCELGKCVCAKGTANCNGVASDGCETSTAFDRDNCGACGKSCGPNQQCNAGVCVCDPNFGDCNMMANDGCEASLLRPETCGSCSNTCGANTTCNDTACGCRAGFLNCDANPGCEAQASSPQSCGSCGTRCSGATPVCNGVSCVTSCTTGQTLCSGVSCVNLQTDSANCGTCGRAVGPNQLCVAGVPTCAPGFANCNGLLPDGCEIDTRSDPAHCGSCPNACKSGAICAASVCECAATTPNDCGTSCRQCCAASDCSDGDLCTADSCGASGTCVFSAACAGGGRCCAQQGCFECCGDADCSGGRVCSTNRCVMPTCTPPQILCGPTCVDPTLDPLNCGGCANNCGPGRTCTTGQCTPQWVPTAPPPAGFLARSRAAAAWTGSEVFIWGGQGQSTALNTGARYNPATNSWTSVGVDANTPSARILATAVWTGSVVVVWGGGDPQGNTDFRDGGRWNPTTNSWQRITSNNAPNARRAAIGHATGSRVLFWGGFTRNGVAQSDAYLYDPATDVWTQASNNNPPPALLDPTTGWSGTDFYVYGGLQGGGGGNNDTDEAWAYNVALNQWRALPNGPNRRSGALGAWDDTYFVVWGGTRGGTVFSDGRRFDPGAGGSWSNVTGSGTPSSRRASHRQAGWAARVSGRNLLILGGLGNSANDVRTDGAIYNSTTNGFTAVPAWPSGEQRLWASGVWTGEEFVLWGGLNGGQPTATGERLRP